MALTDEELHTLQRMLVDLDQHIHQASKELLEAINARHSIANELQKVFSGEEFSQRERCKTCRFFLAMSAVPAK